MTSNEKFLSLRKTIAIQWAGWLVSFSNYFLRLAELVDATDLKSVSAKSPSSSLGTETTKYDDVDYCRAWGQHFFGDELTEVELLRVQNNLLKDRIDGWIFRDEGRSAAKYTKPLYETKHLLSLIRSKDPEIVEWAYRHAKTQHLQSGPWSNKDHG